MKSYVSVIFLAFCFMMDSTPHQVLAASITETSAAIGKDCAASANYATAMGLHTTARGYASTAMGDNTTASAWGSTAMGYYTEAGGNFSFAGGRYMQLTGAASQTFVWGYSYTAQSITTADAFLIFPAGTAGKVGIGTKSPKCLIDARNESTSFNSGDISDLQFLVANNGASVSGGKAAIGFSVSSAIDSDNIFGAMITHTPEDQYSNGGLEFWTKDTNTATMTLTEKMRIGKNGNVGIGMTIPVYKLHVAGNAAKTSGGTTWINSSDERLKDITGEYQRGLDEILSLKPVTFYYKADNPRELPTDEENIGFIAQEVQDVFPEAVSEGPDGYLDFNMHPVNVAVVNAIKELKAENDALKAENVSLKRDIEKIKEILGI